MPDDVGVLLPWAESDPSKSRWAWDQPVPLRWLLLDGYSGGPGDPDRVVAVSAAVQGLFVDRPPPEYERYTLLACRPAGRLAEAIESDGSRTWLGNLVLDSRHDPDRPVPAGCDCATTGGACIEELLDITVLSWHPSAHGHGPMAWSTWKWRAWSMVRPATRIGRWPSDLMRSGSN